MEPEDIIFEILSAGKRVTPWEIEFCESLQDQIGDGRTLSERQLEILERIHTERCL